MAPEIDEFGKKIIQLVRDPTIMSAEIIRNKFSRSPTRLKLNSYDEEIVQEILDIVIPKVIDNTIFYTLRAMDGGGLRMIYRSDAGNACDLDEEGMGELAGWLFGDEGWIKTFSQYSTGQADE
ncbi:MAG: hypothetical protein C0520_02695 [Sphingopyxis sp.]|nr:hypothetical protein [Sphingopyxis sp.]